MISPRVLHVFGWTWSLLRLKGWRQAFINAERSALMNMTGSAPSPSPRRGVVT